MDLQKLKNQKYISFLLRPLKFNNPTMHPNLLLMSKLLIILLISDGYFSKITDPFIPFITWFNIFNDYPGYFEYTLKFSFVLFSIFLFFNFWVRTSCFVLGLVIIIAMIATKPNFFNHILVCGCVLFLAGLTDKKSPPIFLVLQFSIIYFGASFNKVLDADWWSGAFMHNWLYNARENEFYMYISEYLPDMLFAKILSISAFSTEFFLFILLLFKKHRSSAVWFIIIFHTLLFTMTTYRFGHFLESLAIILIAFLNWPKQKMVVDYYVYDKKTNLFRKLMTFLDFDNNIIWKEQYDLEKSRITLRNGEKVKLSMEAIKDLLLYSPMFYFFLLASDFLIRILAIILKLPWTFTYIVDVICVWALILFFLFPIARKPKETAKYLTAS